MSRKPTTLLAFCFIRPEIEQDSGNRFGDDHEQSAGRPLSSVIGRTGGEREEGKRELSRQGETEVAAKIDFAPPPETFSQRRPTPLAGGKEGELRNPVDHCRRRRRTWRWVVRVKLHRRLPLPSS